VAKSQIPEFSCIRTTPSRTCSRSAGPRPGWSQAGFARRVFGRCFSSWPGERGLPLR